MCVCHVHGASRWVQGYLSSQIWGDDEVFSLDSGRRHALKQTSHIRFSNELLGEEEGVACPNRVHNLILVPWPCKTTFVPVSLISSKIKVWWCCCAKVVKNSHVVWAIAVLKVLKNLCEAAIAVEHPVTITVIVCPVTANWTAKITDRAVGRGGVGDARVNSYFPACMPCYRLTHSS